MNAKLTYGATAIALAALALPAVNEAVAKPPHPALVADSVLALDASPTTQPKPVFKAPPGALSPKTTVSPSVAGKLSNDQLKHATQLQSIKPLPRSVLLEAAKTVAGAVSAVDEPGTFTLSPRAPVHEGAFMNFVGGNVWVAVGGDLSRPPAANVGAASSQTSFNRYVEVSFPTRAGYAYVLDCETTGGRHEVMRNWQGSTRSSIATDRGHLVVPLAKSNANARVAFQIASLSAFALSSCEVVPVR